MALCSLSFFCCGRISRKYMIPKIRMRGINWPMASMGRVLEMGGAAGPPNCRETYGAKGVFARCENRVGLTSVKRRYRVGAVARVGARWFSWLGCVEMSGFEVSCE